MKKIFFTKMQGLSKDFVILDWEEYQELGLTPAELAKNMCKRRFGISADGLIIVVPECNKADLAMICFDAQGQPAQVCGDDLRCFAKYVWHKGYVDKLEFCVETHSGVFETRVNDDGSVTVNEETSISKRDKTSSADSQNNALVDICAIGSSDFLFEGVYYYKN